MLEGLKKIDWSPYERQANPSNIPNLIADLASGNHKERLHSWDKLYDLIEDSYIKDNGLTFLVIPFLIELMTIPSIEEKDLISDLLIVMTSFAIEATGEKYKLLAWRIRESVCEHVRANFHLFKLNPNESTEDVDYLVSLCSK